MLVCQAGCDFDFLNQPVFWFRRWSNKQTRAGNVENRKREAEAKVENHWAAHARAMKHEKHRQRFQV